MQQSSPDALLRGWRQPLKYDEMMAELEHVRDGQGSVILGWVAPRVLFARFERTISAHLGAQFSVRFARLMSESIGVRYFADSSAVASYDLLALTAIGDAVLSRRQHFKLIIARPWSGPVGAMARTFADTFGSLQYVSTAAEFNAHLAAAAPEALGRIRELGLSTGQSACAAEPADTPSLPGADLLPRRAVSQQQGADLWVYVFALHDFELGRFTATRYGHHALHPRQDWICTARDDDHALELARRAAFVEWAQPSTRRPQDFSVKFVDAPITTENEFDRRR
jgi:hypothetical protein